MKYIITTLLLSATLAYSASINAAYMLWRSAGVTDIFADYSPLNIDGIESYFDFSVISTIQLNGDYITNVTDLASETRYIYPKNPSPPNQPSLLNNELNGLSVSDNYSTNYLDKGYNSAGGNVFQDTNLFIFIVARINQYTPNEIYPTIIPVSYGEGTRYFSISTRYEGIWANARYGSESIYASNSVALDTKYYHIIMAQLSPPIVKLWVDGQFYGIGRNYNYADIVGPSPLEIGDSYYAFKGRIAEVGSVTNIVSNSDRQTLEGYLVRKWGLSGALPSDHPHTYTVEQEVFVGQPTTNGLVSYWAMEESGGIVPDEVGTNDMVVSDSPIFSTEVGVRGRGADFDGINDYLTGFPMDMNLFSNQLTVSAWVNSDILSSQYRGILTAWQPGSAPYLFHLSLRDYQGQMVVMGVSKNGTVNLGCGPPTWTSTKDIWTHIAAVYSNGTISIYEDGIFIDSVYDAAFDTLYPSSTRPLRIGYPVSSGAYFNGSIDEVRLYNRALSVSEINDLYLYDKVYREDQPRETDIFVNWNPVIELENIDAYFDFSEDVSIRYDGDYVTNVYDLINGYKKLYSSDPIPSKPTILTNALNGRSVLDQFSTNYISKELVNLGGSPEARVFTSDKLFVFTVAKIKRYSPDATYVNTLPISAQSSRGMSLWAHGDTGYIDLKSGDSYGENLVAAGTNIIDTKYYHIITGQIDPPNITLWIDGELYASGTNLLYNDDTYASGVPFYIGETLSGFSYHKGYNAEVGFVDGVVSTEKRQELEGYLARKWGLSGALSTNHPHTYTISEDPFAGTPTTTNLVSYWAMEESGGIVPDEVGTNDMTVVNAPLFSTNYGVRGVGAVFNGTNDYLSGFPLDMNIFSNEMTISSWIYPHTDGGYEGILSQWAHSSGENSFYFSYLRYQGQSISYGITTNGASTGDSVFRANPPTYDDLRYIWTHMAVTYSNGTVITYQDGVTVGSDYNAGFNTLYTNSTLPVRIGYTVGGAPSYFDGYIDEVRLYNRALTAEEINDLYLYDKVERQDQP